eukprot:CAMPEP_0117442362 /NCGR_PEP_ID=MMETSP0759-20121206/4110_1 /TAXON_ID=63605 /ORGANISM="Percolomonas cosmopolitus, Strain WS" /LENGTH=1213 /DNA_ID=CAMNT_0005234243 /DNA_START=627 /DNA_END=4268 /DNA_ORIENTATION=+
MSSFEAGGHQLMTKDSRDSANSAGRGNGTSEQIIVAQTPKSSFIQNKQVVHDLLNRQSENVLARIALEQELKQIVNNSKKYSKKRRDVLMTTFEKQYLEGELAARGGETRTLHSRSKDQASSLEDNSPSTPLLRRLASSLNARPHSSESTPSAHSYPIDFLPESVIQLDAPILERLQFVAREEEGIADQITDILDDIYKHVNTTVEDLRIMSTPENELLINQTIQSLQRLENRRDVWREQVEGSISKTKNKNNIVFKLLQSERAQHHRLRSEMKKMRAQIKKERTKFKELWSAYQTVQPAMVDDSSLASNSPRSPLRVPLRSKAARDSLAKRVMTSQAMTNPPERRNSVDSSTTQNSDSSRVNRVTLSHDFTNGAHPFLNQDSTNSLFSNLSLNKFGEPSSPGCVEESEMSSDVNMIHIQRERKYLWSMVSKKEEEISRLRAILSRKPIKNRMGGRLVKCSIQRHVTEARAFPQVLPHKPSDDTHVKKKEAFLIYENEMLTHQANKMLQHQRAMHQSVHNACQDLTMLTSNAPVQAFVEIFIRWCNEFLTVNNPLDLDTSILHKASTHLTKEFETLLNPEILVSRIQHPSTPPVPSKPKIIKKMKLKRAATFGQLLISSSIHKSAGSKAIPLEKPDAATKVPQAADAPADSSELAPAAEHHNQQSSMPIFSNAPSETPTQKDNPVIELANRRGFRVSFESAKEGQNHLLRGSGTVRSPPVYHHQELTSPHQQKASSVLFIDKSPKSKHIFHVVQNIMDMFLQLKKNQRFLSQMVKKMVQFTNQKHSQLAEPIQNMCEEMNSLKQQLELETKCRNTFTDAMRTLCDDDPQEPGEKKKARRTIVKKKISPKVKSFLGENAPELLEIANLIEKKVTNLPKPVIKKVKLKVPQQTVAVDTETLAPSTSQSTQCSVEQFEIGLQVTFKGERNLVRLKMQEKDKSKQREQHIPLQNQKDLERVTSLKRRRSSTLSDKTSHSVTKSVTRKASKTTSKMSLKSPSGGLLEPTVKNITVDTCETDEDFEESPEIERVAVSAHKKPELDERDTLFVVKKTVEMAHVAVQTRKKKKKLRLYLTDRTRDHMDVKKRKVFRPGKNQVRSRFMDVFRNKKKLEDDLKEDEEDDMTEDVDLASPHVEPSLTLPQATPESLLVTSPTKSYLSPQRHQLPTLQNARFGHGGNVTNLPLGTMAVRDRRFSSPMKAPQSQAAFLNKLHDTRV